MSLVLDLLIVATSWVHVALIAPHTKVEESFNLHAVHDVLMYGVGPTNLQNYDHFVFPGAVPRSFIGSVLLAWLTKPVIYYLSAFDLISSKEDILICLRLVLASVNSLGLCFLRRAVSKRFGFSSGAYFALLTCSQFHLPFWMGRTLPNMFALLPTNLAYAYIVNRMPNTACPSPTSFTKALALLTFTAVIFRAEVSLLLFPLALQGLLAHWITFSRLMKVGICSALSSILITVLIDSYFWLKWPLWPELYSLYFNVFQGKSADWGVSPFHAYLTVHLPKLLLSSAPLALLGFVVERRVRSLLVSPIAFIALISYLGHKEWRFVVYTVPLFNVAAARGACWLVSQRTRPLLGRLCVLSVPGCIAANAIVTGILTRVSMTNYPGGVALSRFNTLFANMSKVHVHIDNLTTQTGASLFLQVNALPHAPYLSPSVHIDWVYNKTEHLKPNYLNSAQHITHVITESSTEYSSLTWCTVECIKGFSGFWFSRERSNSTWQGLPVPEIVNTDQLCILEKF